MTVVINTMRSSDDLLFRDGSRPNVQVRRRGRRIYIRPSAQETGVRTGMKGNCHRIILDDETAKMLGLVGLIGHRFRLKRAMIGRQNWFEMRPHSTTDQGIGGGLFQQVPEPLVTIASK